MKRMSSVIKPLSVIILAVAVAAGAAAFLTRESEPQPADSSQSPSASDTTPFLKNTGGGMFRGPASAKVTLVEFGDYQCPACRGYHPLVQQLLERYPTQLRLEFHHYPLISIHPNAMSAARAAEAAGEQGKYWEMHDLLFEHQDEWSRKPNPETDFVALATRIGLNQNQFMQSMRNPSIDERILKDVVRARDAKVEGVPAFFIDGKPLDNVYDVGYYAKIIDEYLKGTP